MSVRDILESIFSFVQQTTTPKRFADPANIIEGTEDISSSRLEIDGKRVVLIDTPGFDDTTKTDGDILELIAKHLAATYVQGQLLSGIILLHPINGNRVQGSERKRNRLFEKVCGPNAFSKVIIATTMWSDLGNESVGTKRVEERRRETDFWGGMVAHGATTVRHDNNYESTRRIIRMIMAKSGGPVVLQMQRELVENDGRLSATSAGRQLGLDLREQVEKLTAEIEELKRDPGISDLQLRLEIQELRQQVEEANYEQERLSRRRVRATPFICLQYTEVPQDQPRHDPTVCNRSRGTGRLGCCPSSAMHDTIAFLLKLQ